MKVAFVAANFPPEACGGTEQVVLALARELRLRNIEVIVITASDHITEDPSVVRSNVDGIEVVRLQRRFAEFDLHGFDRPRLLQHLEEHLRSEQPDIVHVHSFAGLGLGIGERCRKLGLPMVITCHDLWTTCAKFFRLPAGGVQCPQDADRTPCVVCVNDAMQTDPAVVVAGLTRRTRQVQEEFAIAARCTVPSRSAADVVRRCVPYQGAIDVIPHGLLREVPSEHRQTPPDPKRPLRLGTFGGLVAEKGVRELIEAVCALPCDLHLAGPFHDSAFQAEMQALAQAQCTYLHQRPRYEPEDRHPARDIDLAVFPSKCHETYGLVVDEALAHGVPVVCSDLGALAERADTPGVVVTPINRLAHVLEDLIGSPERLDALRDAIPSSLPMIATSADRHRDLYMSLV